MLRNKLVRSDGSIIDSSVILSCGFTEEVNSNTNLSVGDITSSELTVEILSTTPIRQDEVLTYSIIEDGVEQQIGIFKVEKPTVATRTSMRFSAYDNIIKTEKIFSDWLRDNQGLFPMTLLQLVQHACSHCGVTLATADFPHADLVVNAFYADDLTCRQILAWAGAIAGRFIKANVSGELEFAWYLSDTNVKITPTKQDLTSPIVVDDDGNGNLSINSDNLTVSDDGLGNVTLSADGLAVVMNDTGIKLAGSVVVPFLRDSLSYESYTTDLIERVQINHSEDDVGIIYPADATGNCFTISGNMILGASGRDDVTQVAADLYTLLKEITYVPFNVTVPRTIHVRAGDIVSITDVKGAVFTSYVMKVAVTPSGTTLTATGDKSYESNAAVSSEKYTNLTGKVLTIKKDVDGLKVKNEDLAGRVGSLEISTESFKTSFVSSKEFTDYRTEAEQTAEGFEQRFTQVEGSIRETNAHIRSGVLYRNEDNVPVIGIEIGQKTEGEGVETFNKYAQFTSEKLSFFDSGGDEVASVGDRKMSIANVEITGNKKATDPDYGSFKQGGFLDITRANGDIVSKWVGGVS
jgi:hypothetical protein